MRRDPIPFLPALLTTAALCNAALGQYTLAERAWPVACNQNDEFTAIAAGRLLANYPARVVAVTHDHRLWLAPQPTLLWAASDVTPAGVTSVHGIATLMAPPTANADRLAVITDGGLRVARDTGAGQMVSASATLATWSTVRSIEAFSGVGGNLDLHLIAGVNDASDNRKLHLVHYNAATEAFSNPVELTLPSAIFDVTIGDRDADLAPEVSVVGALGLALYSPTGAFITGFAQALTQGFVIARRDAYRNIVLLVNASGTWFLLSFTPANVLVGHGVVPGGFTSPVRGIAVGAYDIDAHADLIVSTDAAVRWCVPGDSNGALVAGAMWSFGDSMAVPNGSANRCPAILDDIDCNGHLDVVIVSTAHAALIVKEYAIASQIESIHVAASDTEVHHWAGFEKVWPSSASSMFGAKFVVPLGTDSAHVVLWRVPKFEPSAPLVEATGIANLLFGSASESGEPGLFTETNGERLLTVKMVINDENGGNLFGGETGTGWAAGESFMMEVHAYASDGSSMSAVFTFAARQNEGEEWVELVERLVFPPAGGYEVDGWLAFDVFEQEDPVNPPANPNAQDPLKPGASKAKKGSTSTGDRYVGGVVNVPLRVPAELKGLPPAQSI